MAIKKNRIINRNKCEYIIVLKGLIDENRIRLVAFFKLLTALRYKNPNVGCGAMG